MIPQDKKYQAQTLAKKIKDLSPYESTMALQWIVDFLEKNEIYSAHQCAYSHREKLESLDLKFILETLEKLTK